VFRCKRKTVKKMSHDNSTVAGGCERSGNADDADIDEVKYP